MITNINVTQLQHKQVKQILEMPTLLCPVRNAQLFHKVWYQKGTTKKKKGEKHGANTKVKRLFPKSGVEDPSLEKQIPAHCSSPSSTSV
jgi:hypothetical protein